MPLVGAPPSYHPRDARDWGLYCRPGDTRELVSDAGMAREGHLGARRMDGVCVSAAEVPLSPRGRRRGRQQARPGRRLGQPCWADLAPPLPRPLGSPQRIHHGSRPASRQLRLPEAVQRHGCSLEHVAGRDGCRQRACGRGWECLAASPTIRPEAATWQARARENDETVGRTHAGFRTQVV